MRFLSGSRLELLIVDCNLGIAIELAARIRSGDQVGGGDVQYKWRKGI